MATADLGRLHLDDHPADRVPVVAAVLRPRTARRQRQGLTGGSGGRHEGASVTSDDDQSPRGRRRGGPLVAGRRHLPDLPRSFADSNGDGIGDLPGITPRLDHLVELGVDAVWLSPFYPSPQADAGYDVADYRDVDPIFGGLGRRRRADRRGARPRAAGDRRPGPNHTSGAHPWFVEALAAGPGSPARDRYIFRDGRGPDGALPPNGWQSVFGGPAWTRVTEPDGRPGSGTCTCSTPASPTSTGTTRRCGPSSVDILRFWLDRGVDGFRVDVAHGLVKHADLADWHYPRGPSPARAPEPRPADVGPGRRARDLPGLARLAGQLSRRPDPGRRGVGAAGRAARRVRPARRDAPGVQLRVPAWRPGRAPAQYAVIDRSLAANGAVGAPTTWVLSNHDVRAARRPARAARSDTPRPHGIGVGRPAAGRRARAAPGPRGHPADARPARLGLPLPGRGARAAGAHQLPDEARQDPTWVRSGHTERGRDGCRVPIPWEADAPSYGFGPADASWLPQPAVWAEYAAGPPARGARLDVRAVPQRRCGCAARTASAAATLRWLDAPDDVLAFRNGDAAGADQLRRATGAPARPAPRSSGQRPAGRRRRVPTDVTVWRADAVRRRVIHAVVVVPARRTARSPAPGGDLARS